MLFRSVVFVLFVCLMLVLGCGGQGTQQTASRGLDRSLQLEEDGGVEFFLESGIADLGQFAFYQSPLNGTVESLGGGRFQYRPKSQFFGTDEFSFLLEDGRSGVVTFQVDALNDAPVAVADVALTTLGQAVTLSPLDNDFDIEREPLTLVQVASPSVGMAQIVNNKIVYTPGEVGEYQFSYDVGDGQAQSQGSITVFVLSNLVSLSGIGVSPAQAQMTSGERSRFQVLGTLSDEQTIDLTNMVTWRSVTPRLVSFDTTQDSKGWLQAHAGGTGRITAVYRGYEASADITVETELPGAPGQIAVVPGIGEITLDWPAVADADRYNIYIRAENVADFVVPNIEPPYFHGELNADAVYRYRISAVNEKGEGPPSSWVAGSPIARNSTIDASLSSQPGEITLTWTQQDTQRYNLYISSKAFVDDDPTDRDSPVRNNVSSPVVLGGDLQHGRRYYFLLEAVNADTSVMATRQLSALFNGVPPDRPRFGEVEVGDQALTLHWQAEPQYTYHLYWMQGETFNLDQSEHLPHVSSPYLHAGLTNGEAYHYVLTAEDESGLTSAPSSVLTSTPQAGEVVIGPTSAANSSALVPDGQVGKDTVIVIQARDANNQNRYTGGDNIVIEVSGSNTATLTMADGITDHQDGTYTARYTPWLAGSDTVSILIGGEPVRDNPSTSEVAPKAGLVITPANLAVDENGGSATVNVNLTVQPSGTVLVDIPRPTARLQVSPDQLTFDGNNWQDPQIVTFTGVDDGTVDNSETVNWRPAVNASSEDVDYLDMTVEEIPQVAIGIIDDDTALAVPRFTSLSAENLDFSLQWESVAGAAGYYVYYDTEEPVEAATATRIDAGAVLTTTLNSQQQNMQTNTVYYFRVAAYDNNSTSGPLSYQTLSDFVHPPLFSGIRLHLPRHTVHDLLDVVYVNNRYIAVGEYGVILTSTNGTVWSKQNSGTTENLRAVAGGRTAGGTDVYMAVGANNTALISNDAQQWTAVDLTTVLTESSSLNRVVWGNEQFAVFAYRNENVVITMNPDGGSPSMSVVTLNLGSTVSDFLWYGDRYYGVGGRMIYESADAADWTMIFERNVGDTWFARIAEAGNRLVATPSFITTKTIYASAAKSAPGNWDAHYHADLDNVTDMTFTGSQFLMVGTNRYWAGNTISPLELVEVPELTISSPVNAWTAVASNGANQAVAVGSGGRITEITTGGNIVINDVSNLPPNQFGFASIATNGNNIHVAAGRNNLAYTRDDGQTWTHIDQAGLDTRIAGNTAAVYFIKDKFIIPGVGEGVATSTDGAQWTVQSIGPSVSISRLAWNGDENDTRIVGFGSDTDTGNNIFTSANGIDWQGQTVSDLSYLQDIKWIGDRFIVVGSGQSIATGSGVPGEDWTVIDFAPNFPDPYMHFFEVGYNGDTVFIRTNRFEYYQSNDQGQTWQGLNTRTTQTISNWNGELFMVWSYDVMRISPDAIHHKRVPIPGIPNDMGLVNIDNGRYFLRGPYGQILELLPAN